MGQKIFQLINKQLVEQSEASYEQEADLQQLLMENPDLMDGAQINEDDPRQAAQLMRKLSEATGLQMGAGMEEALSRMERGEDPDKIEEEMGDLLEGEEPFIMEAKSKAGRSKHKPKVDETLYDL